MKPCSHPIFRFALKKAGMKEDRYFIIDVWDIYYIFLVGKAGIPNNLNRFFDLKVIPHGVYVRAKKGVYLTSYRSLESVKKDLNPNLFLQIGKSIIVNICKINDLDLRDKVKQVGILVNMSLEWLTVSRRYLRVLRRRVGLSASR